MAHQGGPLGPLLQSADVVGERRRNVTEERSGVVALEVELKKPLGRSKLILVDLFWDDMLSLPVSGDSLTIGVFTVKVIRGPASDEMLLDQPSTALLSAAHRGPVRWYCRHEGPWLRAETLMNGFCEDRRYLSARILP
jgi:hypothetical protein